MNDLRQISEFDRDGLLSRVGEARPPAVDRIDLQSSFSFLERRWKLVLALALLGLAVGAVVSYFQPKVFTANAVVSLQSGVLEPGQSAVPNAPAPAPSSAFVDTQVEIITSREMAQRVAAALGMIDSEQSAERRETIDYLQTNVAASRSGESYALEISFEGQTADEAATIVNQFARQFVDWELNATKNRTAESIAAIEPRLRALRQQAAEDTARLQEYRIANNLLSTTGESLTEQEISAYNQQVSKTRAEVAEAQARLNTALSQLRSGSTGDDVGEALGSPVIASLRAQEAQIAARVASLSARYGQNFPDLIQARQELREVRSGIDAEINRVVSNLRAERDVTQQRLSSLTGSLNNARSQLSLNNAAMVGLSELEREAAVSQQMYETYLNSYQSLLASEGSERRNARILTLAEPSYLPTTPNIPMNMLIAGILGLGLGVVTAYAAESMARGITGSADIETIGQPYLGSVPLLKSVSKTEDDPITAIGYAPRSAYAESFRSLRTSIDHSMSHKPKVIAITSALSGEGKTTTTIGLAQVMAMAGENTLLVDLDEMKRDLSRKLNLDNGHPGVLEVLGGQSSLEEACIGTNASLSILPMNASEALSEELEDEEQLEQLFAELRSRYDRVIIDLPPVLAISASRRLAQYADATIVLARWRKTSINVLVAALKSLPLRRINFAGVALTQVDMRRRSSMSPYDANLYFRKHREFYS